MHKFETKTHTYPTYLWKIILFFLPALFYTLLFLTLTPQNTFAETNSQKDQKEQRKLIGGWYPWDPYQYLETPGKEETLTGLDFEIEKEILIRAGFKFEIPAVSWKQHNLDLETGKRDFAMGAFYTEHRAKYNYLTLPYRYEENSIFTLRETNDFPSKMTVAALIQHIKENDLKIGVIDGYRYANSLFNDFVDNPKNAKYLVVSTGDAENLDLLLSKKIDIFISDKIVGATIIWRAKKGRLIDEVELTDSRAPVYMLLSKKSVSYEEYQTINDVIRKFVGSAAYRQIIAWYLYPVLLLETIDSTWFNIIEILGIISFAFSGVIIAYRINATFLGTFLLALIPSFGGGIFRDVVFGRYPIGFLLSTVYIKIVLMVSLIGFFGFKLYQMYESKLPERIRKQIDIDSQEQHSFLEDILVITDGIGLAAFTVTGVLICLMAKVSPIWLWGPFIAFLSGAGGGFIRDIIVKDINQKKLSIAAINGVVYGEIAIFWSALLSLYLYWSASNVNPELIKIMVILTIIACFVSRLMIYIYNIKNLTFYDNTIFLTKD